MSLNKWEGITEKSQNKQKQKSKMNWNEVNGTSTNDIWSMLFFWQFFSSSSFSPSLHLPVACSLLFSVNFLKYAIFACGEYSFFFLVVLATWVSLIFSVFLLFLGRETMDISTLYYQLNTVILTIYSTDDTIPNLWNYLLQILKHFIFHFVERVWYSVFGRFTCEFQISINSYRIISIKIRWTNHFKFELNFAAPSG